MTSDAENVQVKVDVENTGKADGAETVQIYVQQDKTSISRPVKELRDFAKVFVKAGETKTVELSFSVKEATSFWNEYKDKWESQRVSTMSLLVIVLTVFLSKVTLLLKRDNSGLVCNRPVDEVHNITR